MLIIKRPTTIHNNVACTGPRKSEVMLTESVRLVTTAIDCNGREFMLCDCFPSRLNVGQRLSAAGLNCGRQRSR